MARHRLPHFAARLTELMDRAGLTLAELAHRSGMSLYAISKFRRGERVPNLATAFQLADALGVTVDTFRAAPAAPAKAKGPGRPAGRNSKKN